MMTNHREQIRGTGMHTKPLVKRLAFALNLKLHNTLASS